MARSYRLHLSDGTVLAVDRDGLNTWLVDPKAMVQVENSNLWLPLRQFMAAEREAEFRKTPRRTAKSREELPLIPPPPKKDAKSSPPSRPEPPPAEPPKAEPAPPPLLETPRPAPVPPATPPPRVEPPRQQTPAPPAPSREEPPPWAQPEAPPPREEPPKIEPAPLAPLNEEPPPWARPETPPPREVRRVLPERSPIGEPPGIEPLAAPPAPSRRAPARPVVRPDDSVAPIPLVPLEEPPRPRASDPFAAEDGGRIAPDAYGAEPDAYDAEMPIIPLKPLPDEDRADASRWRDDAASMPSYGTFEDDFEEESQAGQGLQHADVVFLRVMGKIGVLLSRALDSLVRFERRQRKQRAARAAVAAPREAAAGRQAIAPQVAAALQDLGERLVAAIARIRGVFERRRAGDSQSLGELLASDAPRAIPKPKPAPQARTPEPFRMPAEPPRPAAEPPRPPVTAARTWEEPPRPVSRPPAAHEAPQPIAELPVLRLAELPKTEEDDGDLYEGEYDFPAEDRGRLLRGLGRWTKRLIVAAVLVGGGTWAALTWKTWFPRAGEVGQKALTTIDQQVRSLETEKQREQARQAGVDEIPQLAPATIELVLATSDALDAVAIFQTASDAADRGGASLTREEGLEMAALHDELLAELGPPDREKLHDYERSRAFGLTLPSEDRVALGLVARAARALPPARLERLQALLGKAVAAGLTPPSPSASPAATP